MVSNFWDMLYLIASAFFFVAYLIVLFHVVVDLFRDADLAGGVKVLWLMGLNFSAGFDRTPLYHGPWQRYGRATAGRDAARQV